MVYKVTSCHGDVLFTIFSNKKFAMLDGSLIQCWFIAIFKSVIYAYLDNLQKKRI